ncbi:sugar MFS transporter [Colwellia sp. Bg11-28]|uniref:sugar MFS transporter n=1 Tax=Colwellia sp. Bg11-28 TaxID=2058305 RepID=UPI000C32F2EC|nr:sugar MFS transporter [Colwellia sp. Bg11-28]PKH85451.1 glucose/galactose MFS transporter [Colwellia sp. Bg11-28]
MERALRNNDTYIGKTNFMPMIIIGGLFFIFGFVTWINGALIPFLQTACELSHLEAYLVTMTFYIAYTITALPAASVLKKTGYKNGMVLGLFIMVVGSLLFIPAANERFFPLFLFALFVMGTGLTLLQTAANPYIVLLGPQESAAVRISIMGLMNKGAGIVAPILFTSLLFSDIAMYTDIRLNALDTAQRLVELTELSQRLIQPYLAMAVILLVLSAVIYKSPLPEIEQETDNNEDSNTLAILAFPQLVLGAVTLFFYVGVEVIAGDTIGLFGKALGVVNYTQLTSHTMAFMVITYLIGMVCIPRFISQEKALTISALLGLFLSVLIMLYPSESSYIWTYLLFWTSETKIPDVVIFVAMLGFANALVWPTIWPMALNGLGKHVSTGSALLIMGISGGAILPFVYGIISDLSGDVQMSYMIMIPCYLFILFYALKGHKMIAWQSKADK